VDQREKISKQIKKLKTDAQKDEFEYVEQPSSCYTAEGDMAMATLARGDLAGVATLYKEHLDLDPTVALAAGNAALRAGNWAAASGPYRQAIKLETLGRPQLLARQGVVLADLESGDWKAAEPAFQSLYDRSGVSFSTARRYVDGVRAARGQDAALAVARSLATGRPDLLGPQVIFYDEAKRAGDAAATAAAERMVEATAATSWNDIESRLTRVELYAWYRLSQGQNEEAVKLANAVLAERGDRPLAWLVLARASEAAGDAATAAEQRARAMSFGADLPAYALLGP
jgi:predicted Zn-dependent protease